MEVLLSLKIWLGFLLVILGSYHKPMLLVIALRDRAIDCMGDRAKARLFYMHSIVDELTYLRGGIPAELAAKQRTLHPTWAARCSA